MNQTVRRAAKRAGVIAIGLLIANSAHAVTLEVTIENLQNENGLSVTPFLTVFHDGSYDVFDPGEVLPSAGGDAATDGLEAIAELGDTSIEAGEIAGAGNAVVVDTIVSPDGPPPFLPGQSVSRTFNVGDVDDLFFAFAAMVIPSNDLFIANPEPIQIFEDGVFNGLSLTVLTTQIWDAGTEANDNQGAAFNTSGGSSTATTDPIALLTTLGGDVAALLDGQPTPPGFIVDGNAVNLELARITISVVPVPAALPLGLSAIALLGMIGRRRIA